MIINYSDPILVTGANGFIGPRVIKTLFDYGFINIRCFVKTSTDMTVLKNVINSCNKNGVFEIAVGDLLSQEDCNKFTEGIRLIYHLAADMRDNISFESSYLNNVITTKNLLEAVSQHSCLQRFVNMSSLRVYSNLKLKRGDLLDESCEIEDNLVERADAYCNSKIKQEELVVKYCKEHNFSYVTLRPGLAYGPGSEILHRRVGRNLTIGSIRLFLHLGGSNIIPLSYVDNCANAIVLAGIKEGVDGEIFNVVDNDLPTSNDILKFYKQKVKKIKSIYIPYRMFYMFCYLWENCSRLTKGKLSLKFNRRKCSHFYKGNRYSNTKLKNLLGWKPKVNLHEGLNFYLEYQRDKTAQR